MNQFFDNLMQRPTSHKVAIWVGTLLVISYLFWQFVHKDKRHAYTELEEKVENLRSEIVKEQRVARNLKKFKDEVKVLDTKLKFALAELPDKREIPELLSSVSSLARDAGLDVKLFRPSGEVYKDFYAEVPVSVSVEGNYHQVATFFDEVGGLSRIVNISEIAVNHPEASENEVRVSASCLATTFRYLDESERAQAEAAKTTETQKRRR